MFLLIYIIITYIKVAQLKKLGYILLNIYLIIELFIFSLQSTIKTEDVFIFKDFIKYFITYFIMLGCVWTLPNYIYFKKRKHFFNNKNEETAIEEIQQLKNNKEELIKKEILFNIPDEEKESNKTNYIILGLIFLIITFLVFIA